jgi:hypothetical protein
MSDRVKIGSYIIDFAEGTNTSTTTGVVGAWLPDETRRVNETADAADFSFTVRANAANVAQMKTRLDAVRNAVAQISEDVVIEMGAGVPLMEFKTSDGSYYDLASEVQIIPGNDVSILTITIRARRHDGDGARPNPNLPPGALDFFGWQYEAGPDGTGAFLTRAQFETFAQAMVHAGNLRSGASRPVWMPAKFTLHNVGYEMEEPATAEYRPTTLVIAYVALPEWAASIPNLVRITSEMNAVPIRLNERSLTPEPGHLVTISGQLTFKTEANTSLGDGDAVDVASAALRAAADAATDAVAAQAATRFSDGGFAMIERAYPQFSVVNGTVGFELAMVTGGPQRVMEWNETVTTAFVDRAAELVDSEGNVTIMGHALGYEWTVTQNATVIYLGDGPPIPPPPISPALPNGPAENANWRVKEYRPDRRIVERVNAPGTSLMQRSIAATWKFKKPVRNPNPGGGTVADRVFG